ncbi:DUF2303 family protein [Acinetobacter guillouiae]|uniref:DUF2303 family protein n=1 Tax=Acinetobacter guillouiae NIPH 991 TaxID=1217656 RepID=N8Y595_ACIGI|nr:DUF2303 family protein [Acinetobacter guillouiae]ENV16484.1 hypothetical protein F964_03419 [Acinetobacter guillouiae NIPH 991]
MENSAKEIVELALPVNDLSRGELVAVHENFKVHDLEQFQAGRNRARGVLKTPSFEDFKTYVLGNTQSENCVPEVKIYAPVFVDHKNVSATAILNFKIVGMTQGHCDHKAVLQLEPTVVWEKLNQLKDQKLNQKRFATLLEDWASVFSATTETYETINIAEAINAVRNMKVGASTTTDSAVSNLQETRSVFDKVEASNTAGKLPSYFEINDSAYVGLDEKTIRLRLVVNSSDGEPIFSLQIVKEELLRNEIIQEFKEKVIALLPENPVRIGTFQA